MRRLILFVILMHCSMLFADTIKICGVEWLPFIVSGSPPTGISIDIYGEAFRRLGHTIEVKILPWKRCTTYVGAGEYHAISDATSAFGMVGRYPTSIWAMALVTRDDMPDKNFPGLGALKGKTFGLVSGYYYGELIDNARKDWLVSDAVSDEVTLRMLSRSRFDYTISDIFSFPITVKKFGISNVRMLMPIIYSQHLFLSFNRQQNKLADDYDRVVGEMIKDGTMDRIYLNYGTLSYQDALALH